MLDIEGGVDVDAAIEQFLDVEVALRVPAAFDVAVGEFVDQHELGAASDDGVEIHLVEFAAPVAEPEAGDDLEAVEQCFGLRPSMGFDDAEDHVGSVGPAGPSGQQHLKRLADPWRGAEENLETAACFPLGAFEKGVGRGPVVGVPGILKRHVVLVRGRSRLAAPTGFDHFFGRPSRARLSFNTLTVGSPMKPSSRPAVPASTSRLSTAGSRPRALATRGIWK